MYKRTIAVTGGQTGILGGGCNNGCNGGGLLNLGNRNCCNNGCNGGVGVANIEYISDLQAKVARLEAEKYSDINDKAIYQQTLQDNSKLRDEMYAFVKPLADEAANNRVEVARLQEQLKCITEKNELQAQLTDAKIRESSLQLNGKLDTLAATNAGAFNALNAAIECIKKTVDEVTVTCLNTCKSNPPVVYATQGVPASGATWYNGCCIHPIPTTTAGGAA